MVGLLELFCLEGFGELLELFVNDLGGLLLLVKLCSQCDDLDLLLLGN
jgi:hypothetical protein